MAGDAEIVISHPVQNPLCMPGQRILPLGSVHHRRRTLCQAPATVRRRRAVPVGLRIMVEVGGLP